MIFKKNLLVLLLLMGNRALYSMESTYGGFNKHQLEQLAAYHKKDVEKGFPRKEDTPPQTLPEVVHSPKIAEKPTEYSHMPVPIPDNVTLKELEQSNPDGYRSVATLFGKTMPTEMQNQSLNDKSVLDIMHLVLKSNDKKLDELTHKYHNAQLQAKILKWFLGGTITSIVALIIVLNLKIVC